MIRDDHVLQMMCHDVLAIGAWETSAGARSQEFLLRRCERLLEFLS